MTFGDPSEALLRGRDDSGNSEEYLMCATKRLPKNGETTVKLGGLGALQGATGASDKANAVDFDPALAMGAATTVPGGAAATNNQSPLSEIAQVGTAGASSGADQTAVMAAASMPLSAFGATATTMIGGASADEIRRHRRASNGPLAFSMLADSAVSSGADGPTDGKGDVQRDSLDQQAAVEVTETAKLLPEEESQAVNRTASAEELYELVYGQPSDRPAGAGSDAADGGADDAQMEELKRRLQQAEAQVRHLQDELDVAGHACDDAQAEADETLMAVDALLRFAGSR